MPKDRSRPLTDAAVKAAKAAPGQRLEVWDGASPGLCLRVTDRGVKTWVIRYRVNGRQPRMVLGRYPDLDLKKARDAAIDVRRAAAAGLDPSAQKKEAAAQAKAEPIKTVADLAEAYFKAVESGRWSATTRGKKPSTVKGERFLWAGALEKRLGTKRLDDVKRRQVVACLEAIAEATPTQSNRARSLLAVMFRYAVERDRLTDNPVASVKKLGRERPRHRVLTDAEIKTAWWAIGQTEGLLIPRAEGEPDKVKVGAAVRLALKLAFVTLQRRGEIASMRTADLRLAEKTWIQPDPKGGQPHLVPLSDAAVAIIGEAVALQEEPGAYVFPSPWAKLERPITAGTLSHGFGDLMRAAGVEGATLHDVRRTGASAMASERLGVQPVVISRVLGHKMDGGGGAAVTARHYNLHSYASEKRAALDAWAALLDRIVTAD